MSRDAFFEAQSLALERYGVVAETRYVHSPTLDGRAHCLVSGEGPPVVMLNGIGIPAAMWAPLISQLDGHTVYAVDLPAFGLTDPPPGPIDDLRSTAVRFLDEVFDGLGLDRSTIVANSLGSLWAMWFAIERSDRVADLVHVGCPAVVLDTSAPLPMRLLSVPHLGRLMMKLQPPSPRQVEQLSKMVNEHPLPPEIADLILATEQLPGFEQTFLSMLHSLVRLRGSRPEAALTEEELGHVHHRSLLIFATGDPMGSEPIGRRLARALPEAELHMVDGGHAPWIHHADQIGPLVTHFLRDEPA